MLRPLILALVLLLHISSARSAEDLEGENSEVWQKVKSSFFRDHAIQPDLNGEILTLRAPHRAQDAATVGGHRQRECFDFDTRWTIQGHREQLGFRCLRD